MTLANPCPPSRFGQASLPGCAATLRRSPLFQNTSATFAPFSPSENAASPIESIASALFSFCLSSGSLTNQTESIASTLFPLTTEGGGGERSSGEDPSDYSACLELLNSATFTPLHPSIPKSDELTHIESSIRRPPGTFPHLYPCTLGPSSV